MESVAATAAAFWREIWSAGSSSVASLLMLAWLAGFSVLILAGAFAWMQIRGRGGAARKPHLPLHAAAGQLPVVIPALALAPCVVLAAYRLFSQNLFFPSSYATDHIATAGAAAAPALVIGLASGLFLALIRHLRAELRRWTSAPCTVARRALGLPEHAAMARLVVVKATGDAWAQCLPWIFSEAVVAEALFNAQGLGLALWHAAKQHDLAAGAGALLWLLAVYAACHTGLGMVNRRLRERLTGYV